MTRCAAVWAWIVLWATAFVNFPEFAEAVYEDRHKTIDELLAGLKQKYGLKRDTEAEDVNE